MSRYTAAPDETAESGTGAAAPAAAPDEPEAQVPETSAAAGADPTVPMAPAARRGWAAYAGTAAAIAAVAAGTLAAAVLLPAGSGLTAGGRTVLAVFTAAVLCWTLTRADDTFIGMAAVTALIAVGVLPYGDVLGLLGAEAVWLLVAAGILAAGIEAAGLPARAARALIGRATTVRGLFHLVTAGVVLTALAIPSTSGRAALALPVFLALARVFGDRPTVVRALALLFPATILLTAIATPIGAAAHLIGDEILRGMTGSGIGFGHWLLLGVPLAAVSAHLAAELVLLLMTRRSDRRGRLSADVRIDGLAAQRPDAAASAAPGAGDRPEEAAAPSARFTAAQRRMLALVAAVVALWCTESLHGLPPTAVALIGALAATAPGYGTVRMTAALKSVPWPLLVFMVSATALAEALVQTGAAEWAAQAALQVAAGWQPAAVLTAVVAVSAAAHLVLQSRSARAAVLVPAVIPLAAASGLNPAAAVFASTAAAGFCHTLTSSAKPVALFSDLPDGTPTYRSADLLRLALLLGPLMVALVMGAALYIWPYLGLPLR